MPNWKKVIVSGSDAQLNHVTASGNITSSGTIKADGLIATKGDIRAGTHDGSNRYYFERFSSAIPNAIFRSGLSDNNTAQGFAFETRNVNGTTQTALTITGSTRQVSVHQALRVHATQTIDSSLLVTGAANGACIFFGDGSVFLDNSGSLNTRRKDDQDADTNVESVKYKKQDDTEVGSISYNESEEKIKEHYLLSGTKMERAAHTEFSVIVGDAANDANRKLRIDRDGNIKFNEEVAFTKLRQIAGFAAATDKEILDGGMNGF